jgi:hypothetical protein
VRDSRFWHVKWKTELHGLGIGLGCVNAAVTSAGVLWAAVAALVRLVGGRDSKIVRDSRFWHIKWKTEPHGLGIGLGCVNAPIAGVGILWAAVAALVRLVGGRDPKIVHGRRFWRIKWKTE